MSYIGPLQSSGGVTLSNFDFTHLSIHPTPDAFSQFPTLVRTANLLHLTSHPHCKAKQSNEAPWFLLGSRLYFLCSSIDSSSNYRVALTSSLRQADWKEWHFKSVKAILSPPFLNPCRMFVIIGTHSCKEYHNHDVHRNRQFTTSPVMMMIISSGSSNYWCKLDGNSNSAVSKWTMSSNSFADPQ